LFNQVLTGPSDMLFHDACRFISVMAFDCFNDIPVLSSDGLPACTADRKSAGEDVQHLTLLEFQLDSLLIIMPPIDDVVKLLVGLPVPLIVAAVFVDVSLERLECFDLAIRRIVDEPPDEIRLDKRPDLVNVAYEILADRAYTCTPIRRDDHNSFPLQVMKGLADGVCTRAIALCEFRRFEASTGFEAPFNNVLSDQVMKALTSILASRFSVLNPFDNSHRSPAHARTLALLFDSICQLRTSGTKINHVTKANAQASSHNRIDSLCTI